jgi:uncharacterized membrane protein YedE/YeeE
MMDRWWPPIFLIGLGLSALAWWFYQDVYTRLTQPWQWMTLAGLAGLNILASLLMLALRKSAYVRNFGDHFLVATPFLRLNVSYRRIRQTTTASMATLFPTGKMSSLKRETIQPLLSRTAVIVELNSLPMARPALRFFLSPFFFKDQTPHIVLLVQNWMAYSTELESMRVSGNTQVRVEQKRQASILTQLPRK